MKNKKNIGIGELRYQDENGKITTKTFVLPTLDKLPQDIYSNQVVIHHTHNEFTLLFLRVQPPIKESQFPEGESIETPVVAKIVMTPAIIELFINSLTENFEKFKKSYIKK